jgi:hypothetical protein
MSCESGNAKFKMEKSQLMEMEVRVEVPTGSDTGELSRVVRMFHLEECS